MCWNYREQGENENGERRQVENGLFDSGTNDVAKQLVLSHVGADEFARRSAIHLDQRVRPETVRVQTDDQHHQQKHHRAGSVEPPRRTGCSAGGRGILELRPGPADRGLRCRDGHQPRREVHADRIDERQKSTEARGLVTGFFQHVCRVSRQL